MKKALLIGAYDTNIIYNYYKTLEMNIKEFIEDFIRELDDESIVTLEPDIKFKELENWDSLSVLSIMAMIDDKYNVNLSTDEIRSVNTLEELYSLVKLKNK